MQWTSPWVTDTRWWFHQPLRRQTSFICTQSRPGGANEGGYVSEHIFAPTHFGVCQGDVVERKRSGRLTSHLDDGAQMRQAFGVQRAGGRGPGVIRSTYGRTAPCKQVPILASKFLGIARVAVLMYRNSACS